MATFQRLTAALILAFAGTAAQAGYALAKPPPGFQPMPQASPAQWGYAKASNEAWVNGTVRTNTALNVGGRTVTMPAAMRFAANAPRFAAAALFANPYLRFGLAAATWLGVAKLIWDESSQTWKSNDPSQTATESDGFTYYFPSTWPGNYPSPQTACNNAWPGDSTITARYVEGSVCFADAKVKNQYGNEVVIKKRYSVSINSSPSSCPAGNYVLPDGSCTDQSPNKPLTKEEFERKLAPEVWTPGAPSIMPSELPNELPQGVPLPVEIPVINPAPGPLPATPPAPRPYFEPSGDPVPNPNYNPQAEPSPTNQPYIIPGTRIVPSPTPQEPFRVDVQPVERPTTSPTPLPPEELNPQPEPGTNPDQQNQDKPKPEEQQSLCEKHPDILACQKLDEVKEEPLGKEEIQIRINPLGGWGPESAQCPAPMSANVAGHTVELSWQPVCGFAEGLRPIVIALAWLSAASMLVVVARRN